MLFVCFRAFVLSCFKGEKAMVKSKKFNIQITETLRRVVTVRANSLSDAIFKVKNQYKNEEIVLDYTDFKGAEFDEFPTD